MKILVELNKKHYQVEMNNASSLAIAVDFEQESSRVNNKNKNHLQPNHFGAVKASAKPMQAGAFIGDTKQGGSCNVSQLSINPHCNGTHTETIAHICHDSTQIAEIELPALMPCAVISITPSLVQNLQKSEDYQPALKKDDLVISRCALEKALNKYHNQQLLAVVIRTLPNDTKKCFQHYDAKNQPAFFTLEAILYLNERGVQHLITDLPSLDRLFDEGLLSCHHLFWQVEAGKHQTNDNSLNNKTITEMAYINNSINDGFYFVNLQLPAFISDAAPSQPVIYPCIEY